MNKKIIPIVTIVLAIGLFAFVMVVQKQENKTAASQDEWDEQRRPWAVQQEQLEQELEDLDKMYEKSKSPCAVTQVLFTELNEQVYTQCYPILKEFEYKGILALSDTQFPGEADCMSIEQFQELIAEGWKICITWQTNENVNTWWTRFQSKLTSLGVEAGNTVYFPKGTYSAEMDSALQELGFTIAVIGKTEEETPLQLQAEDGIWHVGAIGMMTSKPRLWLRESVAQDANLTYLIGFQQEEELYNEKSFRSMLKCFDEYVATDELIVTNMDEAREHFDRRSLGVSPEVESNYQEQKASLEKKLSDVKKKLKEIDAKY